MRHLPPQSPVHLLLPLPRPFSPCLPWLSPLLLQSLSDSSSRKPAQIPSGLGAHAYPSCTRLCPRQQGQHHTHFWTPQGLAHWGHRGQLIKEGRKGGARVAQPVERPTLGFNSGHDPRVVRSSPVWGSALSVEPAQDCLSLSLCPSPPLACSLSVSL